MNVKVFGFPHTSNKKELTCSPPPSKSHSIRFLLLASWAKTPSVLYNILDSQDITSTYKCLESLGVKFVINKGQGWNNVEVRPPKDGLLSYVEKKGKICFDVGNSGTLLYVLSMLASSMPATFCIIGDESIKSRPLAPICEALNAMQVPYDISASPNGIINIYGRLIREELNLTLEGKFSQVLTGLLFSMPFLHKRTSIKLKEAGEAPYIKMSLSHLKNRGIEVVSSSDMLEYKCYGEQSITGFSARVSADWSSTAFLALASIASKMPMRIQNLSLDDSQGDAKLYNYLKDFSLSVSFQDNSLVIPFETPSLKGTSFNLSNTPDALPALACIASLAKGETSFFGIDICRYKECNRVRAIASELDKLGVHTVEEKDSLVLEGQGGIRGRASLSSYGDHRIALALIALSLSLPQDEWVIIENVECCNISYPNFVPTLISFGAKIEKIK